MAVFIMIVEGIWLKLRTTRRFNVITPPTDIALSRSFHKICFQRMMNN